MRGAGSPPPSWRNGHAAWPGAWPRPDSRSGDRLLTSAESSAGLVVAHVAALRLGLVVVPVNGAYREREIAHIVRDARPSAALVDSRRAWPSGSRGRPRPTRVLVVGPEVELAEGVAPSLDTCAPEDGAMLCYTSGTTGTPKGALLTHANVLSSPAALQLRVAVGSRRSARARAPVVPHARARRRSARHAVVRRVGGAPAEVRSSTRCSTPRRAERRHAVLRRADDVRPFGALAAREELRRVAALRVGLGAAARRPAPAHRRRRRCDGARALRAHRDADELSNPYDGERRAGTVGLPAPRRGDPPR